MHMFLKSPHPRTRRLSSQLWQWDLIICGLEANKKYHPIYLFLADRVTAEKRSIASINTRCLFTGFSSGTLIALQKDKEEESKTQCETPSK
jgi:hypothetical protein